MSTSAVERLLRVLDLEERQGWRNKAVIKGLQEMAPRWSEQARAEGVPQVMIDRVDTLMRGYGQRSVEDRSSVVAVMRRILSGDSAAVESLVDEQKANRRAAPPAPSVPVSASPAPASPAPASSRKPTRPARGKGEAPGKPQEATGTGAHQPVRKLAQGGEAAADANEGASELGGLGSTYVYEYYEPEPSAEARAAASQTKRTGARSSRRLEDLDAAPTILHGVGQAVNEALGRLGIHSVRDLLWHLPSRHEDYSQLRTIADLVVGEQTTVIANLWNVQERQISPNRTLVEATLGDGTGTLRANFWSKWVIRQLQPLKGTTLRLSGKVGSFRGYRTLENPAFEELDQESVATGRIAPIYPATEGISQKKIRQLVRLALDEFVQLIEEPLPAELLREQGLLDVQSALWQMHFPDSSETYEAARRRLAFEELLYVQLGVLQRRAALRRSLAPVLAHGATLLERFVQGLPFALTGAQQRVLDEIAADMGSAVPMTRLVQGDVGSGKTAVAAGAMWIAAANGAQSALLAPTQILAEQHHRGLERLLAGVARDDGAPLQVELLTGRVSAGERERVLAGLRDGSVDVVVGTTAILQDGVEFANLGLIVVDEQHRFGVEQRGALRTKSQHQPHLLAMSATPIPRSLALTVFGDLDLSILNEMPPGRLPVKTVLFRPYERERVYDFLRREASEGRQAFIVYPLVEENETLEAGSAVASYERLQSEVFPELKLALLHGQMKGSEKDAVMSAFAKGEYHILVATTVIEVGIDVPNASAIIIEDADRFGLAQLHQLRGRVGRGGHKSFCVLVTRAEGDSAEDRLRVLERTNDGFVLAEEDLKRRGPGEFLGTRQTGLPELQVAQFSDLATLEQARGAAVRLFANDPEMERHPAIRNRVRHFWRGEGDIS